MKFFESKYCFFAVKVMLVIGLISTSAVAASNNNQLITYPATKDINKSFKSSKFAVSLKQNGKVQNSFVYAENNSGKPGWSGTKNYMQQANHWTSFSFKGNVEVQAERLDRKKINSCVVRPQSLRIKPKINGYKCTFNLSKPVQVSVEIDENYKISQPIPNTGYITKEIVKHPLLVFANPLEGNIPNSKSKGVIYFGPGVHKIGKGFKIPNNTQVYLAGGSYVIGNMISKEKNPKNITVRGRGILSGQGLKESSSEHKKWINHAIDFSKGAKGNGLAIEGITITNPLRSCIVSYNKVDIRNVKLMSWDHRNDGIVAGNNSLIENSFIKVMDDNIKLYYSNQTIRNNVVWQQTAGAVFKLAWSLNGVAQNNRVSNIDIIHSDVFQDYPAHEPDRADMQGKSAIFSALGFEKGAAFQNSSFDNIRIEEKYLLRLMSLRMVSSHVLPSGKTTVWGNKSPQAKKTISNVSFNNIQVASVPFINSTLYGNSGGKIQQLSFSNLKIGNERILSRSQLTSRVDGAGLDIAGNVESIQFK